MNMLRGRRQTKYEPELARVAKDMLAASGLSREEVARRANVSPEWLRQLVGLGRVISDDLLKDFADVVGGDADALLVAAGRKEPMSADLVEAVQQALRRVPGLSPQDIQQIMDVVVEVAERKKRG